jgi:phenylalanyl-tRNA synthetase alpha chain
MSEDIAQLIASLHPLERKVLSALKNHTPLWENALLEQTGLDESRLSMALGWLFTKDIVKKEEEKKTKFVSITDLGKKYAQEGIPEKRILKRLKAGEKITVGDLPDLEGIETSEASTAIGNLKTFHLGTVSLGGRLELGKEKLHPQYDTVLPHLLDKLSKLSKIDELQKYDSLSFDEKMLLEKDLEKKWKTRGLFKFPEKKIRQLALTEMGKTLVQRLPSEGAIEEEVAQLTPELLKDNAWRDKTFRKYNINLNPPRLAFGRKHPYRQFLDEVKAKLVAMGFEEMRGPLVETEFWNNDALYMPQFHPARDIHDVYFVKNPRSVSDLPEPFATRVAEAHQHGWKTGSRGWRYAFSLERSRRFVLRSQGTSVSARTLASGPKSPSRYFSIARCFRYDLVDATHAPDFYQIEGIALGEEITFRTLLGLLKVFATELARTTKVRFLPAYFPYTEPSVEMHAHHPELGWMELGGAGLFRPEVTLPLGVKVPVIAWGLGLDRMAMMALGIHDIRDLFTTDLNLIRTQRAG